VGTSPGNIYEQKRKGVKGWEGKKNHLPLIHYFGKDGLGFSMEKRRELQEKGLSKTLHCGRGNKTGLRWKLVRKSRHNIGWGGSEDEGRQGKKKGKRRAIVGLLSRKARTK